MNLPSQVFVAGRKKQCPVWYQQYRKKNLEKIRLRQKEYRSRPENAAIASLRTKLWSQANPERRREANRKWRDENRDYLREQHRIWRQENKDKVRGYWHRDQRLNKAARLATKRKLRASKPEHFRNKARCEYYKNHEQNKARALMKYRRLTYGDEYVEAATILMDLEKEILKQKRGVNENSKRKRNGSRALGSTSAGKGKETRRKDRKHNGRTCKNKPERRSA